LPNIFASQGRRLFPKDLLENAKLYVFPLTFIVLYEFFHIKAYRAVDTLHPIYYLVLEGGSAISLWIAGYLSDFFSKKRFLVCIIPIAAAEFIALHLGWTRIAIILSPLFVSTAVSRTALIYNHGHRSIKDLIAISYIAVFVTWSFYEKIYSGALDFFVLFLFGALVVFAFPFKDKGGHYHETHREQDRADAKASFWPFLPGSLIAAQACFFLIVESNKGLVYSGPLFSTLGRGSLLAAGLALFYRGNHKSAILLSFMFLFLYAFASFQPHLSAGRIEETFSLGALGSMSGFYLPLVTEQFASVLGKHKRGEAVGLVELMIGLGNGVSLVSVIFLRNHPLIIGFVIVVLAFFAMLGYAISLRPTKQCQKS